eukprot:6196347-Heterocapsa_arctica.AAC.1
MRSNARGSALALGEARRRRWERGVPRSSRSSRSKAQSWSRSARGEPVTSTRCSVALWWSACGGAAS